MGRVVGISQPVPPPNYKKATNPQERCGNCRMGFYREGALLCWGYGNVRVEPRYVCDSWARDSNYKAQAKEA